MSNTLAIALSRGSALKNTSQKSVLNDLALVTVGSLLIAALSQLSVHLPFTMVPVTGQTLGVLLIGATLGSKRAASSVLLYLFEGAIGLPFFAGGAFGFAILGGITAGYLIGFVAAAYAVGFLAERGWDKKFKTALPIFFLGQIIIYTFGVGWLAFSMGLQNAILLGVLPFIPGDLLKIAVASSTLPFAWKYLNPKS